MRIAYVLPAPEMNGGNTVIFQHVSRRCWVTFDTPEGIRARAELIRTRVGRRRARRLERGTAGTLARTPP